jgi:hypothetical protein
MSAKRNLKGHLRQYGYENAPGLTVIAKECMSKNIDFYTELAGKERPALFFREKDSEWLVTMRMEDFMELYRSWEIDTRETRDLPFYGTGATGE